MHFVGAYYTRVSQCTVQKTYSILFYVANKGAVSCFRYIASVKDD